MTNLPKIYGFNKTSEMGINLFAPCIFLGGCNLRCKYCMNHKLVNPNKFNLNDISIDTIKQYVLENKCEWINISGGEPTCTVFEELSNLIVELSSWGCKIGMSTNGTMPEILRSILPYLSYVALDIKSSKHSVYEGISASSLTPVLISHCLLIEAKMKREFDFEVRTTLFPPYVDIKDLHEIKQLVRDSDKWVLQQFRNNIPMLDSTSSEIEPYSISIIEEFIGDSKNIHLRYV